jgi:hypothetical protein
VEEAVEVLRRIIERRRLAERRWRERLLSEVGKQ